jgi:predicted NUDIX family NTP pyrophosphohydrolase
VARRRDSAGLVIFRRAPALAFFLVHPGGPYWTRKDLGAWSIPKGEIEDGEDRLAAAKRETEEETGFAPKGKFIRLPPVRQPSGKVVHPWAIEAPDLDPAAIKSGVFEMEWPPRSGRVQTFPEIDRVAWLAPDEALAKIVPGQAGFIREAMRRLGL